MILNNVKELCARRKISVGQLEKILGLGNGTIYKWSSKSPNVDTLKKVADYFHVTVDRLLREGVKSGNKTE